MENQQKCYDFGRNLGIAFQLQDDFLDAFGDPKTFGKQVGGDIIENKKTYLYLKAMTLGSEADKRKLKTLYGKNSVHSNEKIATVLQVFEQTGAAEATNQTIQDYTKAAFDVLNSLEIDPIKKEGLRDFGIQLMTRTS
jgi:geranylgeranyl diphosphate synthase type II